MASLEIIRLSRTAFTRLRGGGPHLIGETNGQEGHGGVLIVPMRFTTAAVSCMQSRVRLPPPHTLHVRR